METQAWLGWSVPNWNVLYFNTLWKWGKVELDNKSPYSRSRVQGNCRGSGCHLGSKVAPQEQDWTPLSRSIIDLNTTSFRAGLQIPIATWFVHSFIVIQVIWQVRAFAEIQKVQCLFPQTAVWLWELWVCPGQKTWGLNFWEQNTEKLKYIGMTV